MNEDNKRQAFDTYQGRTLATVPPEEPPSDEGRGESEFHISLTATAKDQEQANRLFAKFSATALDVAHDSVSQMVSSHKFDNEDGFLEGEFYNEATMMKVYQALRTSGNGLGDYEVDTIINSLLNAGILFRERR